jgi:hypothetical protein
MSSETLNLHRQLIRAVKGIIKAWESWLDLKESKQTII